MGIIGYKNYRNGQELISTWTTEGGEILGARVDDFVYGSVIKFVLPNFSGKLYSLKIYLASYAEGDPTLHWAIRSSETYTESESGAYASGYASVMVDDNFLMISAANLGSLVSGGTYYIHIWPHVYSEMYQGAISLPEFDSNSSLNYTLEAYFTITYNDNGGKGGPGTQIVSNTKDWILPTTQPVRSPRDGMLSFFDIVLKSNVEGVPDRTVLASRLEEDGFEFNGWASRPDGYGRIFWPGKKGGSVTSDMTLYARWSPVQLITYEYNRLQEFPKLERPDEVSETYYYLTGHSEGLPDTQLKCVQTATKYYYVYSWFSLPDGPVYLADSDVDFIEPTTLRANWTSGTTYNYSNNALALLPVPERMPSDNSRYYTVIGNANGGDLDTELNAQYADIVSYEFVGWGDAPNRNTPLDSRRKFYQSCDVYAIWSSAVDTGYKNNTLDLLPIPHRSDSVKSTNIVTLNLNGGYLEDGSSTLYSEIMIAYDFDSWNTNYQGTGQTLPSTHQFLQADEVYAIWSSRTYQNPVILPTPIREGRIFKGWQAENETLLPGEYTPVRSTTLTAIWQAPSSSYIDGQICLPYYDTGDEWVLLTPYYDTGSEWIS